MQPSGRAGARSSSTRVLDLPHYFIAGAYYHLGLLDRAEAELREAASADPTNHTEQLRTRGVLMFLRGDFGDAISLFEQQRRESGSAVSDSYLTQAYWYRGDTIHARSLLDSLIRSPSGPAAARARASLASFLASVGDRRAVALLDTLEAGQYMDHHVAYSMGAAYAQLGRLREGPRVAAPKRGERVRLLSVVRARSAAGAAAAGCGIPGAVRRA